MYDLREGFCARLRLIYIYRQGERKTRREKESRKISKLNPRKGGKRESSLTKMKKIGFGKK